MNLRRMVQFAVGAMIGIAAVVGIGSAASAQCYPNCVAALTIDDPTAVPGQVLTATATGLDPGTTATGTVNSSPLALGSKTVAANGTAVFTFTVPADYTGAHTVTVVATSNARPVTLTANFTVTSVVAATTTTVRTAAPLARTGDDSLVPLARIGVGLIAFGGAAGYVTRRRRRTAA